MPIPWVFDVAIYLSRFAAPALREVVKPQIAGRHFLQWFGYFTFCYVTRYCRTLPQSAWF